MNKALKTIAFIALALFITAIPIFWRAHERTVLREMIANGDVEGVSRLISSHPQFLECDVMGGLKMTPLYYAAGGGSYSICSNLIVAGADVNAQDRSGLTPLGYAVKLSRTNVVELLLEHGADVTMKTEDGSTALDFVYGPTSNNYITHVLIEAMFKATNHQITVTNSQK